MESSIAVFLLRQLKNFRSHIDASHSRQPLVKGERLVRYEVNAVITIVETLLTPRKKNKPAMQ